jgi:hypothetical protein
MMEIIEAGSTLLAELEKHAQNSGADRHELKNVRLLAPLHRPGKYMAIGMN